MILSLLLAFVITVACLLLMLKTPLARLALDQPNHRSLHTSVTPRTGGLAIMAGVIGTWIMIGGGIFLMIPVILLVFISLADDIHGLKVRWRFAVQLLISAGFIAYLLPDSPAWQHAMMVLAVLWMLNLYNFMDGSDGLAGGMALFGFSFYAIAAYMADQPHLSALCAVIAAANLAFLVFNFHPARIFMGDAGSIPLGFLAGVLGIYGWQQDVWPLWFPLLVFSAFIFDASVTLGKRALRGEKVWEAHRDHYYQRLVRLGWGHRKTAIFEYLLMIATGGSALVILQQPANHVIAWLCLWAIIYVFLAYFVDMAWKSFNQG
jgi:UDP-GlcNAc:undecaprenyl-phosphate GlcNAc-1-phosphate transferase